MPIKYGLMVKDWDKAYGRDKGLSLRDNQIFMITQCYNVVFQSE